MNISKDMDLNKKFHQFIGGIIFAIVGMTIFIIFNCKGTFKYKDEIMNEIKYIEIDSTFGTYEFQNYKLNTNDTVFINKIKKLYVNKKRDNSIDLQKGLHYYNINFKITYKNGRTAEIDFTKDEDEEVYFFTYVSKNVHKYFATGYKDENNQFMDVVNYIIENGKQD